MIEYGFSKYGITTILNNDEKIGSINIDNSKNKIVDYYLEEDVNIITTKGNKNIDYKIDKEIFEVKAPLEKNTKIGKLVLTYNNNKYNYDLVVKDKIKKASFIDSLSYIFKNIISGSN